MTPYDELIGFVTSVTYNDLPEASIERAKRAIQDYFGVALYGSTQPAGEIISTYVDRTASGTEATVLATGTASPPGAALANGTFGHAVSFDDTFESIVIHPTSAVFPAALACAETQGATGEQLLTGYLVGVETTYRFGMSTYPSHYENGWHSTGTVGSFGAATAAAHMLGLASSELRHALGNVASCSSSLLKNGGTMTKGFHAGHAAQIGVRGALLAAERFTAHDAVFDGDRGYGTVMTPGGAYDPTRLNDRLGDEWAISDVGFKPYPSARITHAPMNALRRLQNREGLDGSDVASITVTLQKAFSEILAPKENLTPDSATSSIPFCLATVLIEDHVGVSQFTDEYIEHITSQALMDRIRTEFVDDLFGGGYGEFGAKVELTTNDGELFIVEERSALGSPSNPMSEEAFYAKYFECAEFALARNRCEALIEVVGRLEEQPSMDSLTNNCGA